eukprot:scaffold40430_cov26-Prasinocladus_malaysianus.AAC.7
MQPSKGPGLTISPWRFPPPAAGLTGAPPPAAPVGVLVDYSTAAFAWPPSYNPTPWRGGLRESSM